MKYLIKFLPEVEKKIHSYPECLLMLDFDGTLSAFAQLPSLAYLSKKNKLILQKISNTTPTAIVSGRCLLDIKKKVGIKNLIYAGNHGLEWQINDKREKIKIPVKMSITINFLSKQLKELCKKYPGVLLENKNLGIALHYRIADLNSVALLAKDVMRIIAPLQKKRLLKIIHSNKTLDIQPALHWNKGEWVKFLQKKFSKQFLPIYIGDDITDEDAFKILPIGITIKVGKSRSNANYYCNNIEQVSWFLNKLNDTLKYRQQRVR